MKRLFPVLFVCLAASPAIAADAQNAPAAGWQTYRATGFSISYPPGFAVDPRHEYEALGSGNAILGTAFAIPATLTAGTNLSGDSYLSVEIFPRITCTPHAFLASSQDQPALNEDGRRWLVARNSEGAAGNLYEETVYALDKSVPCIAVRTVMHRTNIANYEPGTVTAFDPAKLTATFDRMRRSLKTQ